MALREYCNRKKFQYLLSFSEYAMTDSSAMLYDAINEKDNHGIVAYSIFQLPEDNNKRYNVLRKMIKKKKFFYFALENMKLVKKKDLTTIENIWRLKKTLPNCLKKL